MCAPRLNCTCRLLLSLLLLLVCAVSVAAEEFKIGIMQAQAGAAKKYLPLEAYLKTNGVDVKFVPISDYTRAATMFEQGEIDGMFSGSGVAGIFILKGLATPLVRPVDEEGRSTYWAVVVGRQGEKPFTGNAAFFHNRTVAFSALASSGEFFFRALPGIDKIQAKVIVAANHEDALEQVKSGKADFAIVKNMVWDSLAKNYPEMERLGQDSGQNPNETLIVSKKTPAATVREVLTSLVVSGMAPAAAPVRETMKVQGFMMTTGNDFKHTLELLRAAGVDASYSFK